MRTTRVLTDFQAWYNLYFGINGTAVAYYTQNVIQKPIVMPNIPFVNLTNSSGSALPITLNNSNNVTVVGPTANLPANIAAVIAWIKA